MDAIRSNNRDGRMVLAAVSGGSNDSRMDTTRPVRKKEETKLVEIKWVDAYTESSWAEYKPETVVTKTYGLLVGKTKQWTTLAMTKEKDYWGNLWHIPTKNVVSMRIVEIL